MHDQSRQNQLDVMEGGWMRFFLHFAFKKKEAVKEDIVHTSFNLCLRSSRPIRRDAVQPNARRIQWRRPMVGLFHCCSFPPMIPLLMRYGRKQKCALLFEAPLRSSQYNSAGQKPNLTFESVPRVLIEN